MSYAIKFFSASVADKSMAAFLSYGVLDHLFTGKDLKVYKSLRNHGIQYGVMPDPETFEEKFGLTLIPVTQPPTYYLNVLKSEFSEQRLKKACADVAAIFNDEVADEFSGQKAYEALDKAIMELRSVQDAQDVIGADSAWELLVRAYKKKFYNENELMLKLGWPSLDKQIGGLDRGDVVSICGRPGQGKTQLMLYAAVYGWERFGKVSPDHNRMFVSMEMSPTLVWQRISALLASASVASIAKPGSTSSFQKHKAALKESENWASQFYVVDGNLAASVLDIKAKALQYKPSAIFIDGAYLLKNAAERDRYRKVAENADLIKKELSPIAPVVCSWQFNRDSKKNKKPGEKPGLEDIAHADAIGQISSIVLGLFEEEGNEKLKLTEPAKQTKAVTKKKVDILKGRSGEQGEFNINWNFDTSDFTEVKEKDVSELHITDH